MTPITKIPHILKSLSIKRKAEPVVSLCKLLYKKFTLSQIMCCLQEASLWRVPCRLVWIHFWLSLCMNLTPPFPSHPDSLITQPQHRDGTKLALWWNTGNNALPRHVAVKPWYHYTSHSLALTHSLSPTHIHIECHKYSCGRVIMCDLSTQEKGCYKNKNAGSF